MKRIGKRLAVIGLAVTSLTLSSCGGLETPVPSTSTPLPPTAVPPTASPEPEPVTINFWEWRGGALAAFMDAEALLFQEAYPWITLTISHFPDRQSYREALNLAFESSTPPDIFIRPHGLAQMIEDGWVQPIEPWLTPEWKARFPAGSFTETMTVWDGVTYSFPMFASGAQRMLFVNEDLFRQSDLADASGEIFSPKTWSELRAMAAQVTKAGAGEFYGIGISSKDARAMGWWFDLASLAGAPVTPYDFDFHTGRFVYGSHPAFAQIVEMLLGMKEDGSVYPYESTLDDSNIYAMFAQGEFAIFMSGPYVVSNLRKDFPDFQNYRVVPLPTPDEGLSGDMQLLPGQSVYLMSSLTQHPEEAWLWINWLSSYEHHQRMIASGSNFSVFTELNLPDLISDPHEAQSYAAMAAYGAYAPFPPARNPATANVLPEAVMPDVGDLLIGIFTGQVQDWRQALVDLDARKQAAWEAAIQEAQAEGYDVSLEDFIFPDWDPMQDYVTQPQE